MRTPLIVLGLMAAGAGSATAQAKPLDRGQPWAAACEGAVIKRVQKEVPTATAITFDADSELQWDADHGTTGVRGDGQYQMPSGGKQPISFECTYDPKTQKVVTVRYTLR